MQEALKKAGIQLSPEQVDLLLDSVLSGDLVRLVAVFNSAKMIDGQLGKLMTASGENIGAARKYFAMHAALFALLVHSQDLLIDKIDKQYLPKLSEIEVDIRKARAKTAELLKLENREDQKRALEGNRESQRLAEDAAKGYRRYLLQQREQIAKARQRATHDLRIADNTFETVEASYPAAQPDARRGGLVRGDPEARGADLRPDLQERGAAPRVREPHAQAGRPDELRPAAEIGKLKPSRGLARLPCCRGGRPLRRSSRNHCSTTNFAHS